NVPQCLIERGERRVEHHPTTPESVPIERLPVMLHRKGILVDQHLAQFVDACLDRGLSPLDRGLAPAPEVPIGQDFHEDLVARLTPGDKGADRGDFHADILFLITTQCTSARGSGQHPCRGRGSVNPWDRGCTRRPPASRPQSYRPPTRSRGRERRGRPFREAAWTR